MPLLQRPACLDYTECNNNIVRQTTRKCTRDGIATSGQSVDGGTTLGSTSTNGSEVYQFVAAQGSAVDMSVTRPGYVFSETLGRSLAFTLNQNKTRSFNGVANRISGHARWNQSGNPPANGVIVTNGTLSAQLIVTAFMN